MSTFLIQTTQQHISDPLLLFMILRLIFASGGFAFDLLGQITLITENGLKWLLLLASSL